MFTPKEIENRLNDNFTFAVEYKEKDGTQIVDFDYHKKEREKLPAFIFSLLIENMESLKMEIEKERHIHDKDDEVSKYHYMAIGKNKMIEKVCEIINCRIDPLK